MKTEPLNTEYFNISLLATLIFLKTFIPLANSENILCSSLYLFFHDSWIVEDVLSSSLKLIFAMPSLLNTVRSKGYRLTDWNVEKRATFSKFDGKVTSSITSTVASCPFL